MAGSRTAHFEVVESAIRGLTKVQSYIEHGMNDVIEVALDITENGGENEGSLRELEHMMKEYIELDNDLHQYNQAVKVVTQQLRQQDPKAEFNLDDELQTQLEAASGPSNEADEHIKMIELREKLWQLQHPGEKRPSQQVTDGDEDEDEPTMTQVEVYTKCPISQGEMVDPVKNTVCNHSYERTAVAELMKQRRGAKCPVTGCHSKQPLNQRHLEDDTELQLYIQRRHRGGRK